MPCSTRSTKNGCDVAGVVLFEVGSALCGAAPSMSALIVGRVLAGAGGTGIYLGTLNFFSSDLVSPERRGAYISGISIVWGLGAVLGPAIGGAFSISKATWRWGFYINLVLGALAAPIWLFLLPSVHPTKGVSIKDRLLRLDCLGFILSAAAWSIFTIVFIAGGNNWAWKDGRTIASLVVCGVLTVAYILQQYFCILTAPSTRSFPGHLLRYKVHIPLGTSTACAISSLYVAIYYIPVYFQFVESDSPLKAAVRILPLVLVAVAVSFSSGSLRAKVKYYKPHYLVSGILITVGSALFYVYIDPSVSAGVIYGVSVVMALGIGLTWQIGYTVATLKVLPQDIGNALSIQNLSQIGGSTIALVTDGRHRGPSTQRRIRQHVMRDITKAQRKAPQSRRAKSKKGNSKKKMRHAKTLDASAPEGQSEESRDHESATGSIVSYISGSTIDESTLGTPDRCRTELQKPTPLVDFTLDQHPLTMLYRRLADTNRFPAYSLAYAVTQNVKVNSKLHDPSFLSFPPGM